MIQNLSIQFLGAAGTVTGSKFLLRVDQRQILIDCGLFQGLKDLRLQNWQAPPFDPKTIDAILLTHAHLDHCGYLPVLAQRGFQGPIFATAPTRDLAQVILLDSAHIQEEDADRANREGFSRHQPALPLYGTPQARQAIALFRSVLPQEWIEIFPGTHARFTGNGHILGSTFIEVRTPYGTILFSGDLGRSDPLTLPPAPPPPQADYLVIESTYGDRRHSPLSPLRELGEIVRDTISRKGHLIIPAFAVGRTQDILFLLSQLKRQSQIPEVPIFLDTPMGQETTEIFQRYPEWHRLNPEEVRSLCSSVVVVQSPQQSAEIQHRKESSIVIAGSGMLTGGRVLAHLASRLPQERNSVLLVGFQAPGTRGALLRSGLDEIKIFGQYVGVRAQIREISSLSAHADQHEIIEWMRGMPRAPKKTFIVHGEPQAAQALRVRVRDSLGWTCSVPKLNDQTDLML